MMGSTGFGWWGMGSAGLRSPLAALVVVGSLTGAALAVNTRSSSVVATDPSGVWFPSDEAASVSHLGPSGVDSTVGLERAVGELRVVELQGVAYIADDAGHLSRLDPVQLEVSKQADLPSEDAQLVAGGGRLYTVDAVAGSVRELDPVQLTAIGVPVAVGAALGDAVVDADGVLWVADAATGRVVSVDGSVMMSEHDVAEPDVVLQLAIVGRDVVAINAPDSLVAIVSGPRAGTSVSVPIERTGSIGAPQVVSDGSVLPILSVGRVLMLADLDSGKVRSIDLDLGDHELGVPQVSAGRAYVPDFTAGALVVVDLASGKVLDTISVSGRPGRFEIAVDRTMVYVNDPRSERAWAVDSKGTLVPATKYDPTVVDDDAAGRTPRVPRAPELSDQPNNPDERDDPPNEPRPPTSEATPNSGTSLPRPPRPGTNPVEIIPIQTPQPRVGPPATVPDGPSDTTPPDTTPAGDGAASSIAATAGDRSATVSWQPPTEWGRRITGYAITLEPGGSTARLGSNDRSFTATGLQNGTQYQFVVTTLGNNGNGAAVRSNQVTPSAAPPEPPVPIRPSAPTNVSADPDDAGLTVSWTAPETSPIAGYALDATPDDGGAVVSVTAGASATSASISGLRNGIGYVVTIRATVADGAPWPSASSSRVVPRGTPGAPTSVTASNTAGGQVTVRWGLAAANGSPVTGYDVSAPGLTTKTESATATESVFSGLTIGRTYVFTVVAKSAVGNGIAASAAAIDVRSQVPDAPGGITASAGDGAATVSWVAPNGNGTTVAGYTIRNLTTGATQPAGAGATSASVTGLANGTSYSFDVTAIGANNAIGPASAASGAVIPSGAPSAPSGLTVTATSPVDVAVTFDAVGASNGTTVGSWRVSISSGGSTIATGGAASFGGLTQSTSYTVSVVAIGANGLESAPAQAGVTTPSGLPAALTGLRIAGSASLTAMWSPSAGAAWYEISIDGGAPINVGTATSYALGVIGYGEYIAVTVTPWNGYGPGASGSDSYYRPEPPCVPQPNCIPP